jgi:hypothetical protein
MVAEAFGQIAPAPSRTGHPQQSVDEAPFVAAGPALAGSAARHKILRLLSLIVAQRIHIPNHQGRSPKISLESRKSTGANPLTLKSSPPPRTSWSKVWAPSQKMMSSAFAG